MMQGDWILLFDIYMAIFWIVVYIECIRIGITQKTYAVPLSALAMNFMWELLSFIDGVFVNRVPMPTIMIYVSWLVLDSVILYTYLRYGCGETASLYQKLGIRCFSKLSRSALFLCRTLMVFGIVGMIVWVMYRHMDNWKLYFAFVDSLLMSVLFVVMHVFKGGRGESLSIAICKWLGTFFAVLTIASENVCALIMGIGCFVLDVYYICLLGMTTKPMQRRYSCMRHSYVMKNKNS